MRLIFVFSCCSSLEICFVFLCQARRAGGFLQVLWDQMQLFRGGFGLRPALHVQLFEDMAGVGFHRGQLHVHDLRDFGIALVRADKMENLQLCGRQLLAGGKARHEEMGVKRRLRPHRWGREMSSHASLPLACGIPFLAVLYILFSSFFAYFLFPIHYNTNISGL